jgi:hypothetical protein
LEALERYHRQVHSASSIVIVGGGPSGVELAGQIATWTTRKKRIKKKERQPGNFMQPIVEDEVLQDDNSLDITLISGHGRLLPQVDPRLGAEAERQLRSLGVDILNNVRLVTSKEIQNRRTRCVLSNAMVINCDVFLPATGERPNTDFLSEEVLDREAYVVADLRSLRVNGAGERVYAIGSCCGPQQKALIDIYRSVPVLVHNLRRDLWELEISLQNPSQIQEERLAALQDAYWNGPARMTLICPITRYGGVGLWNGHRMPSWLVWLWKGRDYDFDNARKVVSGQMVGS